MNKIENYLGVANHDIQMANNSQELKSYVASILCENDELQQENQKLKKQQKEFIEYLENMLDNENDIFSVVRVKDVLSKYKEIIGVSDDKIN